MTQLAQVSWVGLASASGLLIASGALKMRHPTSVDPLLALLRVPIPLRRGRVIGFGEALVGVSSVAFASRPGQAAQALFFVIFGLLVAWVLIRRVSLTSCGCAGKNDTPPGTYHVIINFCAALATIAAIKNDVPPLDLALSSLPASGILVVIGIVAIVSILVFIIGPLAAALQASTRVRARGAVFPHGGAIEHESH